MTSPSVLEARSVVVDFGGLRALDAVSIAIAPGAIAGLVGPNGAGKTTLFNVLSGLVRPAQGVVLLHGKAITRIGPRARARAGIGRTFQHSELFAELCVRDHLVLAHRGRHRRRTLVRDLLGVSRLHRDPMEERVVESVLATLGLRTVAERPAGALPLGIGRLVDVGRALAARPDVVLLDEPSAGLDEHETDQLGGALTRVRSELGTAMLLVEHDVDLVLGLSEHVTVLDFGRVLATGTPGQIRADPVVRAAYLGTAADTP